MLWREVSSWICDLARNIVVFLKAYCRWGIHSFATQRFFFTVFGPCTQQKGIFQFKETGLRNKNNKTTSKWTRKLKRKVSQAFRY